MIATNPQELDDAQRQRLRLLLSSQALDEALAQANADRARKRAAIITQLHEVHESQEKAEAAAEREATTLKAKAEAAHLAWLKAANAHAEAAAAASQARHLHRVATHTALVELADLGGEMIDSTQHICRLAWSQAIGAQEWAFVGHSAYQHGPGWETVELLNPQFVELTSLMKARVDELEGLRLSDKTPAEIDARCAEIRAEVEARRMGPKKDGRPRNFVVPAAIGTR